MFDIHEISLRAKGLEPGAVLPAEVEFARAILRDCGDGIVHAISIVALCGEPEDAPLLEVYLHQRSYFEFSRKALCRHLQLVDRYRPLLRFWMQLEDLDDYRRMPALHLMKEYFAGFEDNELGRYLVDALCDFRDPDRSSIRSGFVDMLHLRKQLDDPFGLKSDEWTDDTTVIVNAAAAKFDYTDWKIIHGETLN
ncbi:hypothetical protein [Rhizobium herbae]